MKPRYSAGHLAISFYAVVCSLWASFVLIFSSSEWSGAMKSLLGPVSILIFIGFTSGGLAVSFFSTYIIENMKRFGHLPGSFRRALKEMRDVHPFSLAFTSSIAEELVFRGAAMYFLGIWGQAVLFGVAHWPQKKNMYIWPVWAFFMGVMLGYITLLTHTIWVAFLIHFIVNFHSMMQLRKVTRSKK